MTAPSSATLRGPGEHLERAPALADLAELVRLPAVVSIPGDAWAGAATSGWARGWTMPAASALLYLGGMALNDWADRDLDAIERPERPIPSGRVDPDTALAVASGLLAGGVVVAGVIGGRRALAVAVPLVASVVAYDRIAKDTPAGPVLMAACRGLDVAMGASGGNRAAALPASAAAAAHALGVTQLSRHEVNGAAGPSARAAIGLALLAAVLAQVHPWREPAGADREPAGAGPGLRTWAARVAAALGATRYLQQVLGGYRAALAAPDDPEVVQGAVGGGVMANTGLQAALLAGAGSWLPAAATTGAGRAAGWVRGLVGGGSVT